MLCQFRQNTVRTLIVLRKHVREHLPKATHHFPEEYVTDRSQRFNGVRDHS